MRRLSLFALMVILLVAGSHADGQAVPTDAHQVPQSHGVISTIVDILDILREIGDYWDVFDFYNDIPGLFSSRNQCLARGYSTGVCDSALVFCALNGVPLGGLSGSFLDAFQLTQLFKVDCGNGECFACCYKPGGYPPCHSAFYDEYQRPVINCNEGYGAGTKQVGHTLVVDPNAKPGQACLFTPQTCDHLALCLSGMPADEIQAINDNPSSIIKSPAAVRSRARDFGSSAMAQWSNVLNEVHTSSDQPSDTIRQEVRSFSAIASFVTGRGCVGWRHRLPESFPNDWSEEEFRIEDAKGVYAEEASHYNGVRQLGLVRTMASLPDLYNRLAFVESRIWTQAAIRDYLSQVGDADSVLLKSMSPIALDVLKRSRQLQDYRLLAVPLPGESVSPRRFNGCVVGDPPALRLTQQQAGAFGIDLRIAAKESASSTASDVETLVLWGDGSTSRVTVPRGGVSRNVTHQYPAGGRYQIVALAQSEAGLKTVTALVIETAGRGVNPGVAPPPSISEVQLVDLRGVVDSSAGNEMSMFFRLEAWPSASEGYALGVSRALKMPLTKPVRFGTIAGWNMHGAPLQSVTIRPSRFGEGTLIGFRSNYFTLDRLRLGVFSTEDNALRFVDVPVTPQMVRLYPAGTNVAIPLTEPVIDSEGRLQIPVQQKGGVRYDRVDLLLPPAVFAQLRQGPITDPAWKGVNGTASEKTPQDEPYDLASRRRVVRH